MEDFSGILLFLGVIGWVMVNVDRAHIRRVGNARIGIRAVKALQSKKRWKLVDRKELTGGERGGQRGVGVRLLILQRIGQATQHAGRIAMAKLLLDAATVVALMEIIADQVDPRVARRLPRQCAAHGIQVPPVDTIVVILIVCVTVAVEVQTRDADTDRVGNRQVEHAFHLLRVVIAILELARAMHGGQVGLGGDEVDHAGRGVATEQRSLRPAQHLDALEIVELALEQPRRHEWHIVDVDAGRRVAGRARAEVADTTDREARRGEVRLGEGYVGQRLLERQRIDDLLLLQIVGGECADRDRHVLQTL